MDVMRFFGPIRKDKCAFSLEEIINMSKFKLGTVEKNSCLPSRLFHLRLRHICPASIDRVAQNFN